MRGHRFSSAKICVVYGQIRAAEKLRFFIYTTRLVKEQILHLDPHDDFNSARDKMGWTQTQRVLLVWPKHGQVLSRRLDLLLLHRHAYRLGAHLALITTDPAVREQARDIGLPVFPSLDASRRVKWRSRPMRLAPQRQRPRPEAATLRPPQPFYQNWPIPVWLMWIFKTIFLIAGLGALTLLALALWPSATITLTPAIHPITLTVEIVADPEATEIGPGLIPARTVFAEVEATGQIATTGLKDVPSAPATGAVIFTNLVGTAATIPPGTGLRTTSGAAIRFVTTQAAALEARLGATVEVPIKAEDPGPAGNVAATQINAIDGPLGLQLAVINPTATSGGAVSQAYAVTLADKEQLRAQLVEQLNQSALGTIEAQLQPGEFLAHDSVAFADVVAESYSNSVGETANIITLTLRIAATGLSMSEADARAVAQTALANTVPPNEVLLPEHSQFERDPATRLNANGQVHFTLTAQGLTRAVIDSVAVKQLAVGQTIPNAYYQLAGALPLAAPPQIVVSPAWYVEWYNRLPWLTFRVDVVQVAE